MQDVDDQSEKVARAADALVESVAAMSDLRSQYVQELRAEIRELNQERNRVERRMMKFCWITMLLWFVWLALTILTRDQQGPFLKTLSELLVGGSLVFCGAMFALAIFFMLVMKKPKPV